MHYLELASSSGCQVVLQRVAVLSRRDGWLQDKLPDMTK